MFVLCGNPSGLFVGVDAYIVPAEPSDFTKVFGKFVPAVAGRCGHRPLRIACVFKIEKLLFSQQEESV